MLHDGFAYSTQTRELPCVSLIFRVVDNVMAYRVNYCFYESSTCPLQCQWYVVVNTLNTSRVLQTCWRSLDVKRDQLSDWCYFGGSYTSTQLFTKALAIVSANVFVRRTFLTNLENRSVISTRNRFTRLVKRSLPRIQTPAALLPKAAASLLLFRQRATPF